MLYDGPGQLRPIQGCMMGPDNYALYKTANCKRAELGRARHSLSRRSENHLAGDSPIVRKSLWRCPQVRKCRDESLMIFHLRSWV